MKITRPKYEQLFAGFSLAIKKATENAVRSVNAGIVKVTREIGRFIIEYEQREKEKAEHGIGLLTWLSKDLSL